MHAANTEAQIKGFVDAIFVWVAEMLEIEAGRVAGPVTKAAKELYTWMRQEDLTGFGMTV